MHVITFALCLHHHDNIFKIWVDIISYEYTCWGLKTLHGHYSKGNIWSFGVIPGEELEEYNFHYKIRSFVFFASIC